jgi:hypothetical protein
MEPSFEQASYKDTLDDTSFHYTLYNRNIFMDGRKEILCKLLFNGCDIDGHTRGCLEHGETRVACYVYNYVSHM